MAAADEVMEGVEVVSDANKRVARDALEALVRGDVAALDEHPGYWQAKQFFPAFFAPFPDLAVEIVQQIAEGDVVATRAVLTGTHEGEWMGLPPSGTTIRCDVFQFDQIAEGRVVEHNGTGDLFSVLAQLGGMPDRPGREPE